MSVAGDLQSLTDDVLVARSVVVAHGDRELVQGVDLSVAPGETVAIVGESGSGKSLTARALVGLLPAGLRSRGGLTVAGEAYDLEGTGLRGASAWRQLRRERVALLLQDPFTSLSPVHTVGRQVAWALGSRDRAAITRRLEEVGLPAGVATRYPHELSGGMRQRVALVIALAGDPAVLIADEPTTALDSLTQAGVLDVIDQLRRERGMGVVLISHDLDLVAEHSARVLVMRHGTVVEAGPTARVLAAPEHPYTRALIDAAPTPGAGRGVDGGALVEVDDLRVRRGGAEVLHGVTFAVRAGEIVGLVGQSGSGKTTAARALAGLTPVSGGTIRWSSGTTRVNVVFQDPAGTLNPALTVRRTLLEAIRPYPGSGHTPESLLQAVGLDAELLGRRPRRLSGGQRQRVAIARVLASDPQLLVCDESVSALDVSVQAQILALLQDLRRTRGLAILFISHDLGVIAEIADRMYVLHEGVVVEHGDTADVVAAPQHDYTRRLLDASSLRRS